MKPKWSLEELMKPWTCTCGKCGGELHIIPYKKQIGKKKFTIDSMNLCKNCTFKEV